MIISRKRFEAEINKAVAQREEELWQRRRYDEDMQDIYRRINALENRVYKLEPKENHPRCETVTCDPAR